MYTFIHVQIFFIRIGTNTMSKTTTRLLARDMNDGFMNGENNPPAASVVFLATFPNNPPIRLPALGSSINHPNIPPRAEYLNQSRNCDCPVSRFFFRNHPFFLPSAAAAGAISEYFVYTISYADKKKCLIFFSCYVSTIDNQWTPNN
jgi:hypothetical protein